MVKRLKWGTIENLDYLIEKYFIDTKIPCVVGLRLCLGISDNCWRYYVQENWRTHRRTDEEIEIANKEKEDVDIGEVYEEWQGLTVKPFLVEEFSATSRDENDVLKARLSLSFKKAKDRLEVYCIEQILSAKNPAGSIYYSKAALGYRENDPVSSNNDNGPTFNVVIQLAAPVQVPLIDVSKAIEVKVIPGS